MTTCQSTLLSLPCGDLVRKRFEQTVSLAQNLIVSSLQSIVDEIVTMNSSMDDSLKKGELIRMIKSDLDSESDTGRSESLKDLYKSHGSSTESSHFYVMFNKIRALKNLGEKILTDADAVFGQSSSKAMCPKVFESVASCMQQLGAIEMKDAQRAIANLTSLTSLYRTLQPGETRNLLANKALKGFISMKLQPSKAFLQALSKHATPELYQQFVKAYNSAD